ncbi:DNA mismatch repair endonuclease MutL [Desulfofundulus thermosubterraneus]|uniref:DNA mismatch repair protein MutL n=1 Tax=Desulfofundulus thermosubterraneus DSM 16057 TaxID=1121432 RepID=A0A1M6BMI6_9FIRM|nr:DNA mismatch repair endonuclease MutL [Desulfofundulus thermosubterraneus]SHI49949.1 DNA mismatch repair protein MutL [Desulfofundulus thermosubterraneus DSM 16057]
MPKIVILDETTANQIAAGEVVERPASVVKELVENSLDAGASTISVEIEQGGLTRIVVRDNGCGMDEEDAQLALLRHATSKIRGPADLSRITTLGFRGEALPSIAAVSKLTLKTRTATADRGTFLEVEGGKVINSGPAALAPGTIVTVENLFYNTPARKKYMKSPGTEGGVVGDYVFRLALARPEVAIRFTHNRRQVFASLGTGKLLDVIASFYGSELARQMLPVEDCSGDWLQIKGYAGRLTLHRSNRRQVTVLINGRYVYSSLVTMAVCEAYHTLLPAGRYPVAVISLSVAPELLDVNVHPAKLEVRLAREREVSEAVTRAVRKALMGNRLVIPGAVLREHEPDLREEPLPRVPRFFPPEAGRQQVLFPDHPPHSLPPTGSEGYVAEAAPVYDHAGPSFPAVEYLGQLMPTYLLATGPDGLYIIDQHAAHERVLYEKYLAALAGPGAASQMLVLPVNVFLTHREARLLEAHREFLASLGFVLDFFSQDTVVVRGLPPDFPPGEGESYLRDIIGYLDEPGRSPSREDLVHHLAAQAACRAAIKAGEGLSGAEARSLLEQLAAAGNPFTCPHGRPTIIHVSHHELAQRFKRS